MKDKRATDILIADLRAAVSPCEILGNFSSVLGYLIIY